MLTLISGGAASGKSEYAERVAVQHVGKNLIYLATMQIWGAEEQKRVARHRALRAGKNFETVERPRDLAGVELPANSVVLLECLSNLTANECFGPAGFDGAVQRILSGIHKLQERADHIIIVTNELFGDGIAYGKETMDYLAILAELNCTLAQEADSVVEVVCGIPVLWKGESL